MLKENEILELYDKIKTVRGVAKVTDLDRDYVSRILAQNGIIDFLKTEDAVINEVISLYSKGQSIKEIKDKLNIASKKITYIILSKNIMRKRTPKFMKQENFFESIDTEEKAYWLGFIYADGYVGETNCNLELTLKDYNHVEKFKNTICPTTKIYKKVVRLNNKECIAYRVNISSKKIIQDLIYQGCTQAKSLTLEWPKYVPSNLIHHFIRGYFDGDGSVGIYQCKNGNVSYSINFVGTEKFLNSLSETLYKELGFKKTKLYKKINNQAFCYEKGGRLNLVLFKEFIYKNATVFLERKKEIFDTL